MIGSSEPYSDILKMLPKEEIQEYGGKGAIVNHIKEKIPDMPIPNYFFMQPEQDVQSILSEYDQLEKPVIVRSSSPEEYGDFEGIFESQGDVADKEELRNAVRQVRKSAESDRAKTYAQQNGFDKISPLKLIIQEQYNSHYCGAMMRHPNNPDLIFISYFSGKEKADKDYHRLLFKEPTKNTKNFNYVFISKGVGKKTTDFLVEKYKQIESLTQIAEGYSLFVEFGLDPFALYQARPFKKIETADFELPEDKINDNYIWSDFAFGITPPEGIVLPVVRSFGVQDLECIISSKVKSMHDGIRNNIAEEVKFRDVEKVFEMHCMNTIVMAGMGEGINIEEKIQALSNNLRGWHKEAETILEAKPYCLMISTAQRDCYDTDLTVPNMKGLVIGDCANFLVHNLIRLFKKANITVGTPGLLFNGFWNSLTSLKDKVRMISNGKEAVVFKD